jgi:hypothetical protein
MNAHPLASRLRRVGAVAVLAAASTLLLGVGPAAALPVDPNAKGFIGLCDSQNHNVSGGSLAAAPFVWKAVASEPPPKAYVGRGENAVLNIYQPRPGVDPADWSGDQFTGATFYSSPDAPAAQATLKDIPLSVIVNEFPPLVDGLYQLRLYFGRTNVGLYSATYPATTIRVQGNRWSVVNGGTVNCAASSGQSAEVLTGAVSREDAYGTATPQPARGRPSSAPTRATTIPAPGSGSGSGAGRSGSAQPVAATHPRAAASSSGSTVGWWILAAAVLAAGGAAVVSRRRRRTPG